MIPTHTLYVSPRGDDRHAGSAEAPLRTLAAARDRLRCSRSAGERATVFLREGIHHLDAPLSLLPEDSHLAFRAAESERAVVSGGRRLRGMVRDHLPDGTTCWTLELPDVRQGGGFFRSLYVGGERRPRAMLPKADAWPILDVPGTTTESPLLHGSFAFVTPRQHARPLRNVSDVEARVSHLWVDERLPLESWDAETGLLTSSRRSIFRLRLAHGPEWARFRLEHVFEGLSEPGEWYLDRAQGRLYYIPLPDEHPERVDIVAGRLTQLIRLEGSIESGRMVEDVTFDGITFADTDWQQPPGSVPEHETLPAGKTFGADAQAATGVAGAISLEGVRNVSIERCQFVRLGGYAIDATVGCNDVRVVGNHMHDLGAGGVKVYGAPADDERARRCGRWVITDNHIHHTGQVFRSAVGILSCHGHEMTIVHNHVHDTSYSAISVGWVWGYAEGVPRDNLVAYNRIEDIGDGELSDLGGIYLLGVQPGTVVRGNTIRRVRHGAYGGWGIYLDQGASHIVVEHNDVEDCSSECVLIHFGRENTFRFNRFAGGAGGALALGRATPHVVATYHHNVILPGDRPIHRGGYTYVDPPAACVLSHDNTIVVGPDTEVTGFEGDSGRGGRRWKVDELQGVGMERGSVFVTPADSPPWLQAVPCGPRAGRSSLATPIPTSPEPEVR